MKKTTLSILTSLFVGSVVSLNAQLITDSFPSNFNNFTVQNTMIADGLSWSSSNGVGGVSGRIDTSGTGNHTNAVYYSGTGSAITKSYTDVFESSIFFLTGASITTDIAEATTGFIRSTGSAFNTAAGGFGISGQLRNDGGGSYIEMNRTGSAGFSTSSTFSLSAGTWYEVVSSLDLQTDAIADSFTTTIYNRGSNGTDPRSVLGSLTETNIALANGGFSGTDFYTGFGGGNNSGSNIAAFDNFSVSVIPEPSSFALIGVALALGLVMVRRRR